MPHRGAHASAPAVRRAGFVVVTVMAFALDLFMAVPRAERRDGHHWLMFGTWDVSISQFAVLLAVVYSVLLLRNRFPMAVLVWMSALTVTLAVAAHFSLCMIGTLVALYTAASTATRGWATRLALVLGAGSLAAMMGITLGYSPPDAVFGSLVMAGVAVTVWLVGRREHVAHLTAAGLRDQLEESGQQAADQERQRIARELHDILAHSVSAMMLQAAGARAIAHGVGRDLPDEPRLETVERALTTIESTGSQSMRELHRLLGALRDDGSEGDEGSESSSQPGLADVERLADLTRQSGLVVEIHRGGAAVALDASVGLAGYRVVQESLANAMKHAGRGAVVDVFESWQPGRLQIQVRTRNGHEGALPGAHGSGTGLYGLRERVALMGGTFESGWVGDEFVTTATLPLSPPLHAAGAVDGRPVHGRPRAEDAPRGADRHEDEQVSRP